MLVLLAFVSGCGLIKVGVAAIKSTDHFIPLESDNRIFYEPNAENLANLVARLFPEAISRIEHEQYKSFTKPVVVYVCATKESFSDFTTVSKQARGAVFNGKLFLSPKLAKEPESIQAILTHELSHLHFVQQLGIYKWAKIPSWFQEGFAVNISNGGGAEKTKEADAIKAILKGEHFVPESAGSFFFHKSASSYGLKPHMFYRQSVMFVEYLKNRGKNRFRNFLLAVENGQSFERSFTTTFGMTIQTMWQKFVEDLKTLTIQSS